MPEGYTYQKLQSDIQELQETYPFLEVGSIGYSVLGRSIPYIRIGSGQKEVFYNASFHANEWITTPVLLKFVEEFAEALKTGGEIFGIPAAQLAAAATIYTVPMVNPDGVDLVTGAIQPGEEQYAAAQRLADNYPSIPFPDGWKADLLGVDLNLQFPAGWEQARQIKFSQGFTGPSPRDFVGFGPLTEPEALSIYNFTLENNFRLILSYHTQGEVIFWKYLKVIN